MLKKFISIVVLFFSMNSISFAEEEVFNRKIVDIGCHSDTSTCFISLSGEPFGTTLRCPSGLTTQFRFDDADTPNGKRTFAALYGAFLAKKLVDVYFVGCSVQGAPRIGYYHIH